eukprot:gene15557-biopygen12736
MWRGADFSVLLLCTACVIPGAFGASILPQLSSIVFARMVRHALFARNKTQYSPVADEWARDHVKMKFAARKRRSLITMCRDFAACFNNEAVPPASVLQISLCRPRPVLVRRVSAFLLPVLRRHELGAPRRTTSRLCSAACRPSCSSAVQ